jgi:hypothetical protein
MARNPRSSDGSAPAIGELATGTSGSRPRTPHRGERVAQVVTDPTRSPEMDAHNDAVRAAAAGHNSGAAGGDGPVPGLDDFGSGGGSRASRNTWADPSSQGAQ